MNMRTRNTGFLVALAAAFGYDMFMLSYAQLCRPPSPGD
jgi:hypothetical protein